MHASEIARDIVCWHMRRDGPDWLQGEPVRLFVDFSRPSDGDFVDPPVETWDEATPRSAQVSYGVMVSVHNAVQRIETEGPAFLFRRGVSS